jgi:hypothetical protein
MTRHTRVKLFEKIVSSRLGSLLPPRLHGLVFPADMAIRLEKAGWGNAETWLGVQLAFDLWHAKKRAGAITVKRYPTPAAPQPT